MHGVTSQPGERQDPASDEVRVQLRKVLGSQAFESHERRRAFLRYVVEEALAGRATRLKGVGIAMAVFGRDETFDQKTDPIVRLEAHRLRRDLDSYYATTGRNDPIRISIPKGSYVPRFAWQEKAGARETGPQPTRAAGSAARQPARRWSLPLGAGLLALLLLALAVWRLAGPADDDRPRMAATDDPLLALPKGPSIAVLPFLNLSGDAGQQYLSDGVTEQVTTELARFRDLWVLPLGALQSYRNGLADPRQLRREFGVGYVLEGSVRTSGGAIRIASRLINVEDARYVWVKTFDEPFTPASIYEVQYAIAEEVAANLAGEYGVLAHGDMAQSKRKAPDSLDAYDCVLRYYDYQIYISPERHAAVKACLERAVALEPDYAEAWAVLANVYMQERRFWGVPEAGAERIAAKAKAAAERAIELDPNDPTGYTVLSNLLFTGGDLEGFRQAGQAALRLNPNSSDSLAHYGLRLALIGDWDQGLALLNKAMTLNPVHPHWYRFGQVVFHYDRGEYASALEALDKIQMPTFFWTHLLRTATLAQLGRREDAKAAAQDLLALKPRFRHEGPELMKLWQFPEPLYRRMAAGLAKAGLELSDSPSGQAPGVGGVSQTD